MIVYPCAKINLGLRIVRRREDGFHDIDSLFFPIPLHDILEVVPLEGTGQMQMTCTGLEVPGADADNLLFRCYELIEEELGEAPSVFCHLHKQIPIGAGLGGGSADAVFFLKAMNELMGAPFSRERMLEMSAQLGSDCPFFVDAVPARAQDTGHHLSPVDIDMSGWWLQLINPGVHVSTVEAYKTCKPSGRNLQYSEGSVEDWLAQLTNDFEPTVFERYPEIKAVKERLLNIGASYAVMSGSGATVLGLFKYRPEIEALPGEFVWCCAL